MSKIIVFGNQKGGVGKTTTGRAIGSYLFTGTTDEEYDLHNTECYKEINSSNVMLICSFSRQNHSAWPNSVTKLQ